MATGQSRRNKSTKVDLVLLDFTFHPNGFKTVSEIRLFDKKFFL
ncbi:MAG: hypothetical protein R2744_08810 [Bacteroidales bacterium]